ncbi:histidine phosphatase family protein [Gordonia sp. CPCC 206044]|uniref:histidine phosphatase family protein n=1 Tax=Gordonia sp. CPCC 206044 TaxID=3140793 RepID=UPI003AF3D286
MVVITAGRTGPNRSLRFGGDPSLDDGGRRGVARLRDERATPESAHSAVAGPEAAVRESCAVLGVDVVIDDELRSLDVGRWSGLGPEQIDPAELGRWFADPHACPHGGESIAVFVDRVHRWRSGHATLPELVVVAMPVAQALLAPDAAHYFEVEVRPATRYSVICH